MTSALPHPIQTTVLRSFLEIARCQSIRQAADELNVAASALSRHVVAKRRQLQRGAAGQQPPQAYEGDQYQLRRDVGRVTQTATIDAVSGAGTKRCHSASWLR